MVGGRSYNQSQFNRAIVPRRQPGSVFKPFVYLAAFEQRGRGGTHRHHAGVADQRRADDVRLRRPDVGAEELRGRLRRRDHLRRALAHVAQPRHDPGRARRSASTGSPRSGRRSASARRRRLSVDRARRLRADAARGRQAYTLFPNGGAVRPLHAIDRIDSGGKDADQKPPPAPRAVARARHDVPRDQHDAQRAQRRHRRRRARGTGFTLDAAGKTGTTNDLRDAWFVGFTPELLTVVWVGFDDNQPLGLSGAQAALPIWTAVHEERARRPRQRAVRRARGHHVRRDRPRHRQAARPRLPAR